MKQQSRPESGVGTPAPSRRLRLMGRAFSPAALFLLVWLGAIAVLGVAVDSWFWILLFPTILSVAMTVGIRQGSEVIQDYSRRLFSGDDRGR